MATLRQIQKQLDALIARDNLMVDSLSRTSGGHTALRIKSKVTGVVIRYTCPFTSSDHRGMKNCRTDVRRKMQLAEAVAQPL